MLFLFQPVHIYQCVGEKQNPNIESLMSMSILLFLLYNLYKKDNKI